LRVFADAEHNAVPIAVDSKIGTVVGSGDNATPVIAVSTMRKVRRDFESCAYTFSRRVGVRISAGL
jgi:hypothetical protein